MSLNYQFLAQDEQLHFAIVFALGRHQLGYHVPDLGNRGHILLCLCRGDSYSSCCLALSVHVPAE